MGQVKVVYKQPTRGSKIQGAEITDPADFFKALLVQDFAGTKAMFEGLSGDQQSAFIGIFG